MKLIWNRDVFILYPNDSLDQVEPAPGPVSGEPAPEPALPPPYVPVGRWRRLWQRLWRWEYFGITVILVVTLGFHFASIMRPTTIVWDEKWYVGDARSIITGGGDVRPEHPPLAKLFIVAGEYIFNGFRVPVKPAGVITQNYLNATGDETTIKVSDASIFKLEDNIKIDNEHMRVTGYDTGKNEINVERDIGGTSVSSHLQGRQIYIFTDNAFGWRFFSVVFGTLGILIFYFICLKLKFSRKTTLIATFLFAFENMTFLHAGLALLDIYMVTFMLAAVLLYLDEKYLLSGVFVALSAQCKLTGVLIIFALFLHFVIYRRDKWVWFVGSLLLAAVSFAFFTVLFDFFMTGAFENPIDRIHSMLNSTSANQFSVPKLSISSRPWTWLYPQFVQLYYNSPNVPFIVYSYDPQYLSFISSTIQFFMVPVLGYMVYKAIKGSRSAGLVLLWFLTTYVFWIPLTLVMNRVTFVFYFLATTPAICIGFAMVISDFLGWLRNKRELAGRTSAGVRVWYGVLVFYFLLHFAIFIVFNPAIPTIIKTWLPPFAIGVDPTAATQPFNMLASLFLH